MTRILGRRAALGLVAVGGGIVCGAALLAAQTPPAATSAGAERLAADVAHQASVLAADSFQGRTTPSAALERTARYITAEFARLGLAPWPGEQPGGPGIRRYPVPGGLHVDPASTAVILTVLDSALQATLAHRQNGNQDRKEVRDAINRGATPADTIRLDRSAYFAMSMIPRQPMAVDGESWTTVVVAGPPVSDSAAVERLADQVAGKSVLYVPPAGLDSTAQERMVARLAAATGLGVLVLAADDSATFARRWQAAQARLPQAVEYTLQNALRPHGWVAYAWPGALAGALASAQLDLTALRATPTPVVRAVPALKVDLELGTTQPDSTWPTAPNVFGWLEGRDSTRFVPVGQDSVRITEFVLLMAHMDEASPDATALDRADAALPGRTAPRATPSTASLSSNTLGVAGLLALAQALSQPEARPRRSVLFLVTSGGATPTFAGAHWSLEDGPFTSMRYPLAAVFNLDQLERVGATRGDTVWVDGLREVERIPTVDWIAATHPELGLTVLDGGTAFAPRSDHFGFLRLSRPMLHFHATPPAEAGPPGAAASGASGARDRDVERAAQIVQLVFHVTTAVANSELRPQLNKEGRMNFTAAIEHLP